MGGLGEDFFDKLMGGEFHWNASSTDTMETMTTPIPFCFDCARFHEPGVKDGVPFYTCEAFPDGIPTEILVTQHDYDQPYPGDHGLRYQPEAEKKASE